MTDNKKTNGLSHGLLHHQCSKIWNFQKFLKSEICFKTWASEKSLRLHQYYIDHYNIAYIIEAISYGPYKDQHDITDIISGWTDQNRTRTGKNDKSRTGRSSLDQNKIWQSWKLKYLFLQTFSLKYFPSSNISPIFFG